MEMFMSKMRTVYIAGPLTPHGDGNHAVVYLHNVRTMLQTAMEVIKAGMAPFVPGMDFPLFLMPQSPTEKEIKAISMEWLRRSDAVLVTEGWQDSRGTIAELEEAVGLKIPVFTDISQLEGFFRGLDAPAE